MCFPDSRKQKTDSRAAALPQELPRISVLLLGRSVIQSQISAVVIVQMQFTTSRVHIMPYMYKGCCSPGVAATLMYISAM